MTRLRVRSRVAAAAIASALAVTGVVAGCGRSSASGPRMIVLGFDGLDYALTKRLIDEGKLPAFARLAKTGGFTALGTSIPPQSPVAWSSFITGLDPGGHGIFDFVHRDASTMAPYLSTTKTEAIGRTLRIGGYRIPLSGGSVTLLREGEAFWEVLEARGIETTIVRMPANFPPSGTASTELSGMGTPDILGTYGTFALYTSEPFAFAGKPIAGGTVHEVSVLDGVVEGAVEGPENPFLEPAEKVTVPFKAHVDAQTGVVKLVVGEDGAEERVLKVGEWTDWVPVEFPLAFFQQLRGMCRFYLKQVDPYFQLYVTPTNIDPMSPAMPISTPASFASELAEASGRFYTQGMPEDTKSFSAGVFGHAEFLHQARMAGEEVRRQYRYALDRFERGLLFYYVGNVDQVSHMLWRSMDPQHPAYDAVRDAPYRTVIEDLYIELDRLVGETLDRVGPETTVVVMSDHGFTSWRRAFHLNSWLEQHGYLTLRDRNARTAPLYTNVDWSRTRAYGLGLNGLYINVRGREKWGIVEERDRAALAEEIAAKLLQAVDPATGQPAITKMYRRDRDYRHVAQTSVAPDLVVGYAKGTRGSNQSALGEIPADVIVDNTDQWSGDHCMDHEAVPGVLLTSRPLKRHASTLQQLAGSLLAEYGIEEFPRRTR